MHRHLRFCTMHTSMHCAGAAPAHQPWHCRVCKTGQCSSTAAGRPRIIKVNQKMSSFRVPDQRQHTGSGPRGVPSPRRVGPPSPRPHRGRIFDSEGVVDSRTAGSAAAPCRLNGSVGQFWFPIVFLPEPGPEQRARCNQHRLQTLGSHTYVKY